MNDASSATAVNHHADHPGFAGATGVIFGFVFMLIGRARAKLVADTAQVSAADRIVDVGCGPGSAAREAARRGARVTGVDPAPAMLTLARLVTRKRAGITWREGTAEHLPVADGSATLVWALATVHHWQDVARALTEAHRVLMPGGRLLTIERQVQPGATGTASHGWTRQQADTFAALCRDMGLDTVCVGSHGTGRRAVWIVSGTRRDDAV